MVDKHAEREKREGAEIKPAAANQCRSNGYAKAEGSKFNITNLPLIYGNGQLIYLHSMYGFRGA